MKELLMALTVVINMLGGHVAYDAGDGGLSEAAVNSTTTTTLSLPHRVARDLEKCDLLPKRGAKNLCYAKATGDRFFCDRITDDVLKEECLQLVSKKTN